MKRCKIIGFYILFASIVSAENHTHEQSINTTSLLKDPLTIMSYNVRRKGADPKEHQWDERKERVCDIVKTEKPTVVGFQEVTKPQFKDLKRCLIGYKSFGDSRNEHATVLTLPWLISKHWQAQNEYNPIFYNPEKVKLIYSATFEINSSFFFKQLLPRICTYGIFEDKKTKKQFYVFNTHLDNNSEAVRNEQLHKILNIRKIGKHRQGIPAIVMGDMNTKIEGDIKKIITDAGFSDAREKAQIVKGPKETRTGWNDNELKEIDHILVKDADVEEFEVIKSPEGIYPSDHRPVVAKIIR